MDIKAYVPATIEYTKESGELSTRTVIPTTHIPLNIRAADLTSLSPEEQDHVSVLFQGYEKYVQGHMANMFKFQDWVEHTTGKRIEVNWRTFKLKQTSVVG